jgi:hypothetical protein
MISSSLMPRAGPRLGNSLDCLGQVIRHLGALAWAAWVARTRGGQRAVFTRSGMVYPQVSEYSDGSEWVPCKTVGSAYVGSNPTPATTCGNGPWPADARGCGPLCYGLSWSRCVHVSPAVSGVAGKRTASAIMKRGGWSPRADHPGREGAERGSPEPLALRGCGSHPPR